jgi:hypothetical protein
MYAAPVNQFCEEETMAEQSASQLISDWVAAAKSANTNNAHTVATTIANFYANNAVLCTTPDAFTKIGIVNGQSDIEKDYEANFGAGWVLTEITPNQPQINSIDQNWSWAFGQWTGTFSGTQLSGSWSILFNNQPTSGQPNWLIQQHTIVTNPAATNPVTA